MCWKDGGKVRLPKDTYIIELLQVEGRVWWWKWAEREWKVATDTQNNIRGVCVCVCVCVCMCIYVYVCVCVCVFIILDDPRLKKNAYIKTLYTSVDILTPTLWKNIHKVTP